MKKFEYSEPLFNVVKTSAQDILTASEGGSAGGNNGNYVTPELGF